MLADVEDRDLVTANAVASENGEEELTSEADERSALFFFCLAGSFAHHGELAWFNFVGSHERIFAQCI